MNQGMQYKMKDAFLCCSFFMNELIGMEEFQFTVGKIVRGLGDYHEKVN